MREVDQDMVAKEERVSEGGSDTDSGWLGVSDNSSTDSECTDMEASSIASDQDRILPTRRCRTWQMTSTTLTSHDTPKVAGEKSRDKVPSQNCR